MAKNDTSSQMRKLVKQFKDSGQSQKEFAAAHWTCNKKLDNWLNDYAASSRLYISNSNSLIVLFPKKECLRLLLYQVSIH
jgi:hypothetical protein